MVATAYDPDVGDYHSYQVVGGPAYGSAYFSGATLIYYPPANWYGTTTLSYQAFDSKSAASNVATVTITVSPVNDAPVAVATTLTTPEDTAGAVTLSAWDIDSPSPTVFQIVSPPAVGSAYISGATLVFTPPTEWSGTTTLTYIAQDSAGAWSAAVTVTITVTAVNDVPVAAPKTLTVNEDTSGTVTLTATDVDSPTPTVFQLVADSPYGTSTISGATLTFTPDPNWNGATTVTYRAQDSAGAWSAPATISITVTPVNDAPVAAAKTLTTPEDTPGTVTLTATDVDSPAPSVFQIVTPPTTGTASISGSTLTFTPPANWSGSTSLTYRAQDSAGAWSAPVTVSITVSPVNDVPVADPKTLTISEDTSGAVTLTATDVDSPAPTTFQVVTDSADGSSSITGATLTFTPDANWNGVTTVTYRAQDSAGAWSAPATVTITVNPVNDAPVAAAKNLTIAEDTSGTVTLTATDVDSPAPSVFQIVTTPTTGTAFISGSTLTFTPPANWSGSTSLTYRAQDSAGAWSAPATVSITVTPVNDAPVAAAKAMTIDEDTPGTVTLTATDIDSPVPSVFQVVSDSPNGTSSISGATLTFVPDLNWNGVATVTYRAQDSSGAWSAPVTVTITVNAVNDAPVAAAKSLTTPEDTAGTVALTATDVDSPVPTVFQIVAASANGTASISGTTLTFTPAANWFGSTTVTYRAQDTAGAWSAPATVSITVTPVNDAPVAATKAMPIDEDTPGTVTLTATDVDSPAPAVFQVVNDSADGTSSISGSALTFTPDVNWNGTTTVTFKAQDASGAWSAPATITITVTPVNDAPVVAAKSLTTPEDTDGTVTLTATDVDSPVPTVFQIVAAPANGTASISSGAILTFTPAANWFGSTSLTYRAQDSSGTWSAPATVTITVTPVNDAPVAAPRSITTLEDTIGTVTLSATDVDSPVPTVFQVVNPSANGSATISGATLTFTPAANWFGTTTVTYRAQDTTGAWSAPATVSITVTPVNDAPVASPLTMSLDEDVPTAMTLLATDIDSAQVFTFEIVSGVPATAGAVTIVGNQIRYNPASNWNGTTQATYRAKDPEGAWSAPATVSITVRPVNDVPVAVTPVVIRTQENRPTTVTVKVQL